MLGDCFYFGHGVEKDYTESEKWYKLAAENGNEEAKEALKSFNMLTGAPIHWEDLYTRPGSTITLDDLPVDNTQGNEKAEETLRHLETDSD